jgi:beta-glucosidase
LKGFKRIELAPGERKTVTFHLAVNQLGFYNRAMKFVVEPGSIDVMVGSSSDDIRCTGSFEITGRVKDISATKTYFSTVDVR